MPTWGTGGYGTGKYGLPPVKSLTIGYYLSIFTSEYQNAGNFLQWASDVLEVLDDNNQCLQQFDTAFDVNQAVGAQQDIIGQLVGAMRVVGTVLATGAPGPFVTLDDATYQTYLKSAIAKNTWTGTLDALQNSWNSIFPQNPLIVADAANMSATIIIGGFLSPTEKQLILADLAVPRPLCVQYYYAFTDTLPLFGCDSNNGIVAGLDVGYFS